MREIFVHLFNDFNIKKRNFWFQIWLSFKRFWEYYIVEFYLYKSIKAGIELYLIPLMIFQLIVYTDIKRFEWDNFIFVYKYIIYIFNYISL